MPIYEYQCAACNGRFEVQLKFSDPAVTTCRLCGSGDIKKLLSPAGFVLKGSGWYVTDYPSKDRKAASQAEKPGSDSKQTQCTTGACASAGCSSEG